MTLRTCGLAFLGVLLTCLPASSQSRGGGGTTRINGYLLKINDEHFDGMKSFDGGSMWAPVVNETKGATGAPKKHVGAPKCEDLTLVFDAALPKPMGDWVNATWLGGSPRKDISLIGLDRDKQAVSSREFVKAGIAEVAFPKLDASLKGVESCITVKLSPESIRTPKAEGKPSVSSMAANGGFISNFSLEIPGLDCSSVVTIESIVVKSPVTEAASKKPSLIDFSNLKITLPESGGKTWLDWYDDFVVKGNSADGKEKSGQLSFFDLNRGLVVRVKFANLGICRIGQIGGSAVGGSSPKLLAELYCEGMELELPTAK